MLQPNTIKTTMGHPRKSKFREVRSLSGNAWLERTGEASQGVGATNETYILHTSVTWSDQEPANPAMRLRNYCPVTVTVLVNAKGFMIEPPNGFAKINAYQQKTEATFYVTPIKEGKLDIDIDFIDYQQWLGKVTLTLEVKGSAERSKL